MRGWSSCDSFWLELISLPLLPSPRKIPPPWLIPGAICKLRLILSSLISPPEFFLECSRTNLRLPCTHLPNRPGEPTYFSERTLWAPLNSDQKGIHQCLACTWEKCFLQEKQNVVETEKKADKIVQWEPSLSLNWSGKNSLLRQRGLYLWNTSL